MKKTDKILHGTLFHGEVFRATVGELRRALGEPTYCDNHGKAKVNFEWQMETAAGELFTVYDWKEWRPLTEDETVEWYIGGETAKVTCQAFNEIIKALG